VTGHASDVAPVTGLAIVSGAGWRTACRRCPVDGTPLATRYESDPHPDAVRIDRYDAVYCSPRCRQAASRARRGLRHGWGDTTDRAARRARAVSSLPVTGQEEEVDDGDGVRVGHAVPNVQNDRPDAKSGTRRRGRGARTGAPAAAR
jgi:hypothetical protein